MPVPASMSALSTTPSSNSPAPTEIVGTIMNQYFQAAFAFIAMLYDGGIMPTAAVNMNGQQVNNAAAGVLQTDLAIVGQLGSPTGTRVVLQQAAAPVGWTVDTTAAYTDAAMRFNQTVGSGGTSGLVASGWISGGIFTSGGTAITAAQMPAHNHTDTGHNHGASDAGHAHDVDDPGHAHVQNGNTVYNGVNDGRTYSGGDGIFVGPESAGTNAAATGIGINTGYANISVATGYADISSTGGGGAHTHTVTPPNIKYADCVVIVKS